MVDSFLSGSIALSILSGPVHSLVFGGDFINCEVDHISPHCTITTSWLGLSLVVRVFSTIRTTSIPSITWPKTTCLLFRNGVAVVVMKN